MTKSLFFQAIFKMIFGVILIGVLLFLPAGTFHYPAAWLFMGVLFVPMLLIGIILMIKSPNLLRKRLNNKEEQTEQKLVVILSILMFVFGFIMAGLNFRYAWIVLPDWVSLVVAVLFLFSYLLYAEVMRENAYLSRTVEVQENQKVVSVISFAVFLVYPFIIAKRIKNEEKVLEEGLQGYVEYKKKVKYKVIPLIW